MKTLKITDLKKDILVVELPKGQLLMDFNNLNKLELNGFKKLGFINEIKEEDVIHLVERTGLGNPSYSGNWYECYKNSDAMYSSALDSFNSALESEIYWNNPIENPDKNYNKYTDRFGDIYLGKYEDDYRKYKKAQEKTFDRNRALIFVKN